MGKKPSSSSKAKSTQKSGPVAAGEVWAVPVPKLGYCPAVITRIPAPNAEVQFAYMYLLPELSEKLPQASRVPPLRQWPKAWMGLVALQPFKNGRWTKCGVLAEFDAESWPVPPCRVSAVDESKPPETWGQYPWGEMWSIEVTPDEPTMLVIDNSAASRDEALRFPQTSIVTAASSFEKALVNYFKSRSGGFWGMELVVNEISTKRLDDWAEYPAKIRAQWPGPPSSWFPAGRATDRNLVAGTWLAFPIQGGGYGAALLIDKPTEKILIFADVVVMAVRRMWDRWPTIDELISLTPDDGLFVMPTNMLGVRDGRWRALGMHPNFDPEAWTWPRPWRRRPVNPPNDQILVNVREATPLQVKIDPAILALDPYAGERCRGSASYGFVEIDVPRFMNQTSPFLKEDESNRSPEVTPQKLAAWRAINAVVIKAVNAHRASKAGR